MEESLFDSVTKSYHIVTIDKSSVEEQILEEYVTSNPNATFEDLENSEILDMIFVTKIESFTKAEKVEYMYKIYNKESKIYSTLINNIKSLLFNEIEDGIFENFIDFYDLNKKTNKNFIDIINDFSDNEMLKFSELLYKNRDKITDYNSIILDLMSNEKFVNHDINYKTHNIGKDYENHGILSLFKKNLFDMSPFRYYEYIDKIFEHKNNMEKIVKYISEILEKNKAFTFSSVNNTNISELAKCSTVRFMIMIFQVMLYINKKYNYNNSDVYNLTLKTFYTTYNTFYRMMIDSQNEINMFGSMTSMSMFGQLFGLSNNKIKQNYEILKTIMNDNDFNKEVLNLVETYQTKSQQEDNFINDDILDSIIEYYFTKLKYDKEYKITENVISYFIFLLGHNKCNKHFKFDIITYIGTYLESNKYSDDAKKNYNLIKNMAKYFIDIDHFSLSEPKICHNIYQNIFKILLNYISKNKNNDDFKKYSTENSTEIQNILIKFIHKINTKNIKFLDTITSLCEEIKKILTDFNVRTIQARYLDIIRTHMKSVEISLDMVINILESGIININVFRGEIILPIITLATNILKYFTDGKILVYNLFQLTYEGLYNMQKSIKLLYLLKDNEDFLELLRDNKDILIEAMPTIKLETEIKEGIQDIINKLNTKQIKIDDIPEEYLDPLIYMPIKEPVMIPNVDLIFDKSSIMSQILHEGINPYTREKLSEEILEEFNKKESVIHKVKEFTNKFDEFKKSFD